MQRVYFDHAATTPPRPEVMAAMEPYLWERWGNPSSLHAEGVSALEGVERGRQYVAGLLGAGADEIVFTGCGTEADNQALIGSWLAHREWGDHLITTVIEHPAVGRTANFLESQGVRVTYLPVDRDGLVDPDAVRGALTEATFLVSVMHANNEIGSIQPVQEIGEVCRARGVTFHVDAVQTVGHVPIDLRELPIDLLALSGHKLYGPKGIGALFVREGVKLAPYLHGGGHERGRRSGTENVPGIVGLGEAARLAKADLPQEAAHTLALREQLIEGILQIPGAQLTGARRERLPNNVSFCLPGVDAHQLVIALDAEGFSVSSGSACHAGSSKPSHVLEALGLPTEVALGALRVSLGRSNTREQVDRFLAVLPPLAQRTTRTAAAV